MRAPRPYTRQDREYLIQLLYRFHCRAMDEKKYDVAKRSSLLITEIASNWRRLDPPKYPKK